MAAVVMTLVLIISILIRLVAVGLSIRLLYRILDWRVGFLAVMLVLMASRQVLALLAQPKPWIFSLTGFGIELPGLAVSGMALLAVFFVGRTMTEHKRVEKALRENDLRLKLALDSAQMGVWTWTLHNNAVHWTPECYEVCGVTSHVEGLKDFTRLVHPEDLAQVMESVNCAIADRTIFTCEFRIIRPDGSVRWLSDFGQAKYDTEGRPLQVVGTVQDITERKKLEAALKEKEALLNLFFNTATVGMAIHDADLRIVKINKPLAEVNGLPVEVHIGRTLREILPAPLADNIEPLLQKILLTGESILNIDLSGETRGQPGVLRHWIASYFPIMREAAKPVGIGVIVREITERKQAEEALRESEERLRLFIQHAPAAIAMFDRGMRYIAASQRWLSDFRLGNNDIIGRSHYDVFPDLPLRYKEVHQRCLAGAVESCEDDRFTLPDGTTAWFRWETHPWHDSLGQIGGIILFTELITERKQAEEALRESEERYRTLVELSPEAIFINHGGRIVFANPACLRLLGAQTAEQLLGRSPFEFVPPDAHEEVRGLIKGLLEQGKSKSLTERKWVRLDGTTVDVEVTASVLPFKGDTAIQVLVRDITERKRAAEALRVSRELLNNIINSSPSYIFGIDLKHRYILANNALAQLFGMQKEEILGKTEHDVFPKSIADRLAAANDRIMAIGTPQHFDEVVESKSGGLPRVVASVKFPLRDAEGKIRGLGGVATDITEHKRVEEALRDSVEQSHALSRRLVELQESERRQISRELHDEVGQILAGIKLTLESTQSSLEPPARASLAEAVELVDDLISRVRDLSLALRPSMLDDLGLLPTLNWHMGRYTKQTHVDVHFQHLGMERRFGSEIETAAYRIIQGALTNVAMHAHVKEVSVRCELQDNILLIEIEDHGTGFNPSRISRTSPGLSGMQERAEVLGGSLTIVSAPGTGTRITVRLPCKTVGTEGSEGL